MHCGCEPLLFLLTEFLLLGQWIFDDFAFVRLKLTKLADPQMYRHSGAYPGITNPDSMFEIKGINPKGIMCILDNMVLWVQATR